MLHNPHLSFVIKRLYDNLLGRDGLYRLASRPEHVAGIFGYAFDIYKASFSNFYDPLFIENDFFSHCYHFESPSVYPGM